MEHMSLNVDADTFGDLDLVAILKHDDLQMENVANAARG
jgi:hypothetical protein